MSEIDWIVLGVTLFLIVGFGIWKSRHTNDIQGFFLAGKKFSWYHIGLSVMATQASAITFLSAPGMGFTDGLRFVQFYFGLPLAMIVICIAFIPNFSRLNVYTAYEYLESRFDLKTRTLTSILFLIQRGLSNGISIYAPSLVLSAILKIDIIYTTIFIGVLVMIYTIYGGTRAVSYSQLLQMIIIFSGLIISAITVVHMLPSHVGLGDALKLAGRTGKMNAIDFHFDLSNKYNVWSGIIGGFFLQLSYFGTDQSQVGRYLTGSTITQSRMGLVMNGLIKIPMQFFILLIGVLVFVFYLFVQPPAYFNPAEVSRIENSHLSTNFKEASEQYYKAWNDRKEKATQMVDALSNGNAVEQQNAAESLNASNKEVDIVKSEIVKLIKKNNPKADVDDNNYIFLGFITSYLPIGLAGLMVAIIFLASMGSMASGLNALASATVIDIYKRIIHRDNEQISYLKASRISSFFWGVFSIGAALFAGQMGNLIEAVNVLGSLFYGTILGIFITAFFVKSVKGNAVFIAAVLAEIFVVISWWIDLTAFLWLNLIGCVLVVLFGLLIQGVRK